MDCKTSSQEKLDKKLDKAINTPSGKITLRYLIDEIGVSKGIRYCNEVEKRAPKNLYSATNPFVVQKITHTLGLVFNNGLAIKHVDKAVFKYATQNASVEDVKERLPRNNFIKV